MASDAPETVMRFLLPALLVLLHPPHHVDPVEGRVVDSGGRPIAGAIVSAQVTDVMRVSVYADGEGRFRQPTAGLGRLTIRAPGYDDADVEGRDFDRGTKDGIPRLLGSGGVCRCDTHERRGK